MKHLLWIILYLNVCLLPAEENKADKIVKGAEDQIGKTLTYDPSYVKLKYPNGDVPIDKGVCTDVVVRALRNASLDLQKLVHEDMKKNFSKYPKNWGLKKTDKNIDHRRVPNLMTFFKRKGWSLAVTQAASDFKAGDIVVWRLSNGRLHTGIVVMSSNKEKQPHIIHNIGDGAQKEDVLLSYTIIGHYRVK